MQKKDIYDLLKSLEEKNQQINEIFDSGCFLDEEISILWAIIEDSYGLTAMDNSTDVLAEFGCGNLTKTQLKKKLKEFSIKS